MDIKYTLNPKIVRGLDYYTKTAWEIVEAGERGKLNALGGGGRYDELVSILGGRETPAVGFAMGIERIVLSMQEAKAEADKYKGCDVYIAQLGVEARKKTLKLFEELRTKGFSVAENMSKKGLKDQLDAANKRGAKYTLILGQKEIADDTILLRDMESGVQEVINFKKVDREITKRLNALEAKIVKAGK